MVEEIDKKKQEEEDDRLQLFEAQDKMIQDSIKVISLRFNVLLDLVRKHGLDVESGFRSEQRKFQIKIG